MIGRALPLKVILVAVGSIATLFVAAFVAYSVRDAAAKQLTLQIGSSAAALADQIEYKLDSDVDDRSRQLIATSKLIAPVIGHGPGEVSDMLGKARAYYADLNWIGLFNMQGQSLGVSTNSLDGRKRESWPFVSRLVSAANTISGPQIFLSPSFSGGPEAEHIEMAMVVTGETDLPAAVLVASFDWNWAEKIGRSLGGRLPTQKEMELLVVTDGGKILVGPAGVVDDLQNVASFREALKMANGFKVETWADGHDYVTGFARSSFARFNNGHDWIVLVRQNALQALGPVGDVQQRITIYAIIFALHAIVIQWFFATRIVDPLLQISRAADDLRSNSDVEIPVVSQFAEVQALSKSLISLVATLKARESSLEAVSNSLELQVAERTEKLAVQNEALEAARKVAEEATIAKTRFLAAASHDLRQPMQALALFANALNKRAQGTESAPIVKNLEESIASLRNMFDALLHVSRLESGLIVGDLTEVSLRAVLSTLIAEFQVEAAHRGLDFRYRIPDLYIVTEPALFEVVIRNLVSNALKFTKHGGILIGARKRSDNVIIEILDTGPGISMDQHGNVFREFERAKTQATGPNYGLGLGLSIADRYARLTGAQISVRSRIGRGTRFSLLAKGATGVAGPETVPARCPTRFPGLHVMLLDDNTKDIQSLSLFLKDLGAVVTSFETAEDALEAVRTGLVIDFAIVDYDLGGHMSGVDFLNNAHTKQYDFGAIILTGRTDPAAIEAMARSGRAWINKPAAPEAIATIMGRLTTKGRRAQDNWQNLAI